MRSFPIKQPQLGRILFQKRSDMSMKTKVTSSEAPRRMSLSMQRERPSKRIEDPINSNHWGTGANRSDELGPNYRSFAVNLGIPSFRSSSRRRFCFLRFLERLPSREVICEVGRLLIVYMQRKSAWKFGALAPKTKCSPRRSMVLVHFPNSKKF